MRSRRYLVVALLAYPAWLAMMAVHEAGHVIHALTSGARIERVIVPLTGFSGTDLAPNPHPRWTAWGGPLWGCVIPLALLGITHLFRRGINPARAFAGFCLIANGAYIGLSLWMSAGDGRDLIRHGAPPWTLIAFGTITIATGLYLWHRATPSHRRV